MAQTEELSAERYRADILSVFVSMLSEHFIESMAEPVRTLQTDLARVEQLGIAAVCESEIPINSLDAYGKAFSLPARDVTSGDGIDSVDRPPGQWNLVQKMPPIAETEAGCRRFCRPLCTISFRSPVTQGDSVAGAVHCRSGSC